MSTTSAAARGFADLERETREIIERTPWPLNLFFVPFLHYVRLMRRTHEG